MKAKRKPVVDVEVSGGGVYTFTLRTDTAREWVEEHVHTESWQWLGSQTFVTDDGRMAHDIADGMVSDGLRVI